jgi:hypothetical protein
MRAAPTSPYLAESRVCAASRIVQCRTVRGAERLSSRVDWQQVDWQHSNEAVQSC